jgi:flagellar biosynthetic protein FliP
MLKAYRQSPRGRSIAVAAALAYVCFYNTALAQAPAPPAAPIIQLPAMNSTGSPAQWNILVLLTLLTFLPALIVSMTPFIRILVTFHFLRQALSTQSTPTNQTLIGLALFLTYFVMQPVGAQMHTAAVVPWENGKATAVQALNQASMPLRKFMLHYVREKDLALFVEVSRQPRPASPDDLPMRVVIPAYMISELKTGFQIGLVLFLPFLVIDMVVAAITTSVGMMQLPPVMISTPLKILLFVLVDGWNLVVGSLLKSFY